MKVMCIVLGSDKKASIRQGKTSSKTLTVDNKTYLLGPESVFMVPGSYRKEIGIGLLSVILAAIVYTLVDSFGIDILISIAAAMIFGAAAAFSFLLGLMRRRTYTPLAVCMEDEVKPLAYMDRFSEWQVELERIIGEYEGKPSEELFVALNSSPVLSKGFRQSPRPAEEMYRVVEESKSVQILKFRTPWYVIAIIAMAIGFVFMALIMFQLVQTPPVPPLPPGGP